ELANAAYGQAAVQVTPMQMALVAATIANDGVVPGPYVVRDRRTHAAKPAGGPTDVVLDTYRGSGGQSAVSPSVAAEMRAVMVDAVQGAIGRIYAGQGAVTLYGVSGISTAGKTGTAERGPGLPPHSWFIGFAPAQAGATPAIAVAVIVEGSGGGSTLAAPIGGQVMAEWLKLLGG
ncbi:MAG: penicillin-binding transpeptidase domain-containing protein, partial [Chloroflexota bacterium]|nr:penicillin-binding transpeptidase domain-containing protein [Chloroflexota bacterium]